MAVRAGDVVVRTTHPRVLPDSDRSGDVSTQWLAARQVDPLHGSDAVLDLRRAARQRGRVRQLRARPLLGGRRLERRAQLSCQTEAQTTHTGPHTHTHTHTHTVFISLLLLLGRIVR